MKLKFPSFWKGLFIKEDERTVSVQIRTYEDMPDCLMFRTEEDAIEFCKYLTQLVDCKTVSLRCNKWNYGMVFYPKDFKFLQK